jgi:catechol 2,3-dioxygenase-like lactoylglutathione lyase family enzyme
MSTVADVDMKLEVVVIPVSDVDRAKEFYSRLGWRLDADRVAAINNHEGGTRIFRRPTP